MENRLPADVTEDGVGGTAGKRARELVGFLCCSGVLSGPDLLRRTSFTSTASSTLGNPLQKQWLDRLEDQRGA